MTLEHWIKTQCEPVMACPYCGQILTQGHDDSVKILHPCCSEMHVDCFHTYNGALLIYDNEYKAAMEAWRKEVNGTKECVYDTQYWTVGSLSPSGQVITHFEVWIRLLECETDIEITKSVPSTTMDKLKEDFLKQHGKPPGFISMEERRKALRNEEYP